MITLACGGVELDLAPEIGGSVIGLRYQGRAVLRPVAPGTTNVLETACFPLVPYANRIENGVFSFEGREIRLPLNFGDHPNSLHGHGWQAPWRVGAVSRDRVVLAYDHVADAWPWAYAAEQVFAVSESAVHMQLSLRNRSDLPMPFGLGLHPYFPRLPGSSVAADVAEMWMATPDMIPSQTVPAATLIDLAGGQLLGKAPFVDNTFTRWKGPARIMQPELGLEIELSASTDCRFFHLFVPEGSDFFCAEPTTSMPNAFNRPSSESGAKVVAPGATASMEMQLTVRQL